MYAFPKRISLTNKAGSAAMWGPRYSTIGNTTRCKPENVVTDSISARLTGIGRRLVRADVRPVYLKQFL